jgi:hypothetical protein
MNRIIDLYLCINNNCISYYNRLKYRLFDINSIIIYNTETNKIKNIYLFYLIEKMLIYYPNFITNYFTKLIDNYLSNNLINVHIKSSSRECKFIYKDNLSSLIKYLNNNRNKIEQQINLPSKYIIRSCEINNYKNIHHLFYLYYDPDVLFPHNTIINILNINQIKWSHCNDVLIFNIFKGRPYVINKNISDISYSHINIINNLL